MIKFYKSNILMFIVAFIMCLFLLFNPLICARACLDGISVWTFKVLPMLFPFFVLTRLLLQSSINQPNFMDKFFAKIYHTPTGSFLTYVLSVISGYPVGAKLICDMKQNGNISTLEAKKMLSFCSVSGPMFIIGTVGIMILNSTRAGVIILISNILASLINGILYRGKEKPELKPYYSGNKKINFTDCVHDALISVLMVGAYITISFLFIEILSSIHVFDLLSNTICWVFGFNTQHDVITSTLTGLIEITSGIINLSTSQASLFAKTTLASGLIGFGGISVMLQSINFLSSLNIPIKTMLKQKTTQALFSVLFCFIICLFFL